MSHSQETESSGRGSSRSRTSGESGGAADHSVEVLEAVLGQIGKLEQLAPDLHATLAETIKDGLFAARNNQPIDRKLDRLRCLSDKISHRQKQLDKWDNWIQDMQQQIDEARGKFADLEAELRELQQDRKELLQEIHGEAREPDEDSMEDDEEEAEEEAAAKRRRDEAENE